MSPLTKILVVTQSHTVNHSGIYRAIGLARPDQAQVTLFSVAEELPKEQLAWITLALPQELITSLLNEQRLALVGVVERYHTDCSKIETSNAIGPPFIEVIKKVKLDHYDLLVLVSKTSDRRSKRIIGSTTMHLMRKCPCPVWAVGKHEPDPLKHIVVAVDVYAPTEQVLQLNKEILQSASTLAIQESAELHIIHVWQKTSDESLIGWGITTKIDRCEMVLKEQSSRREYRNVLVNSNVSSSLLPTINLLEGKPQNVIPEYVETNQVDLIVMGTLCRTGIAVFLSVILRSRS